MKNRISCSWLRIRLTLAFLQGRDKDQAARKCPDNPAPAGRRGQPIVDPHDDRFAGRRIKIAGQAKPWDPQRLTAMLGKKQLIPKHPTHSKKDNFV